MALYEVLGVSPDCTTEEVKQAYARLRGEQAEEGDDTARRLREAYDVLSDAARRHQYDGPPPPAPPPPDRSPATPLGTPQRRAGSARAELCAPGTTCPNAPKGCPWSGAKDALRVHLRNCIFFEEAALVLRKDFRDEIARLQTRLSQLIKQQRRVQDGSGALRSFVVGAVLGFGAGVMTVFALVRGAAH